MATKSQNGEVTSSPLSSPPEEVTADIAAQEAQAVEELPHTTKTASSRTPAKKTSAKRTPRKRKWTTEKLMTDTKSPLATADLRSALSNPAAWEILSPDERREVLSLFPDTRHIIDPGTDDACLNFGTLMNDDNFRQDCAGYTENVAQGRHDPEWLASAWAAHERRKMGDFDEHLVREFENDWEVELPEDAKPRRGDAARDHVAPEVAKGDDELNGNNLENGKETNDNNSESHSLAAQHDGKLGVIDDELTNCRQREDHGQVMDTASVDKQDADTNGISGPKQTVCTLRKLGSVTRMTVDGDGGDDELA